MTDRQGAKEHRVHDSVHRRGGADPERQREDSHCREQGVLPQSAPAVSNVEYTPVISGPSPGLTDIFDEQGDVSQVTPALLRRRLAWNAVTNPLLRVDR